MMDLVGDLGAMAVVLIAWVSLWFTYGIPVAIAFLVCAAMLGRVSTDLRVIRRRAERDQ